MYFYNLLVSCYSVRGSLFSRTGIKTGATPWYRCIWEEHHLSGGSSLFQTSCSAALLPDIVYRHIKDVIFWSNGLKTKGLKNKG